MEGSVDVSTETLHPSVVQRTQAYNTIMEDEYYHVYG